MVKRGGGGAPQVLRFFCVWDDRRSLFGDRRPYRLHYFLEDATLEVLETADNNNGRDPFPVFLRRGPLPRVRPARPSEGGLVTMLRAAGILLHTPWASCVGSPAPNPEGFAARRTLPCVREARVSVPVGPARLSENGLVTMLKVAGILLHTPRAWPFCSAQPAIWPPTLNPRP